jgi:uncharacterized damage-inducible protein DinB
MVAYHRRLFRFDHWANLAALEAVIPIADRVPRSVAWLAHIAAAKRIWHARVTGTSSPAGVTQDIPAADLRSHLEDTHGLWTRVIDGLTDADTDRLVRYTNLRGEPFTSPLGDILTHLPIHGQHHRGQVAADVRAAGGTPPVIDFIHATRTGHL